jgi:CBS domain-containing protein
MSLVSSPFPSPSALTLRSTALDAARWMRIHGKRAVAVVEDERPVGLVTQRNLVARVLARGWDPREVLLEELCQDPIVTVPLGHPAAACARRMREHGTRWLVVVDPDGRLAGLLDVETLFRRLAAEVGRLDRLVGRVRSRRPKAPDRKEAAADGEMELDDAR